MRHDRGRIIEENHYYAYGLKIAALSSKAFGGAPNNYQYQGDYSEFDAFKSREQSDSGTTSVGMILRYVRTIHN